MLAPRRSLGLNPWGCTSFPFMPLDVKRGRLPMSGGKDRRNRRAARSCLWTRSTAMYFQLVEHVPDVKPNGLPAEIEREIRDDDRDDR